MERDNRPPPLDYQTTDIPAKTCWPALSWGPATLLILKLPMCAMGVFGDIENGHGQNDFEAYCFLSLIFSPTIFAAILGIGLGFYFGIGKDAAFSFSLGCVAAAIVIILFTFAHL